MSTTEQDLTIGPAAAALGVSVRTLRHWDDLGILRPAGRAASGYRLYSADDVVRGRRILAYRELGFSLDEVTALLHEPAQQTVRRLRERRSAAEAEARRLQAAQDDLDRLADAIRTEGAMVPGSAGQPVVNPALTEARGQRLALHRLLSALQLPADDGVPLPTPVTVRNRQAAKARWPGRAV